MKASGRALPTLSMIVAGLLVFAVVLVAYLPASWVVGRLPPELQLNCGDVGGSIWEGECREASWRGARLGDATWNLGRLAALRGRLVGNFDLRGALAARADLDLAFSGDGELRNVKASLPLDPQIVPGAPADQRGNVTADLARLSLARGAPRIVEGTIELTNLRQVSPRPMELGSYRATFDGKETPDGAVEGSVRDLGGPFAVEAALVLTPPRAYALNGFITGRTVDAERIVRNQIAFGAVPDASGRNEFGLSGAY